MKTLIRSAWLLSIVLPAFFSSPPHDAWAAAPEVSSRPVVFVHGFNPLGLGEDCQSIWGSMKAALASQGFTGQMTTVGYYFDDPNCDVMTSPHGSILTPIEDVSKDFAWYVYDEYSNKGVDIDVVAHSMGGLVVRYALYRVAVGDAKFPPFLRIAHVATLGSPFAGYSLLAESCHIIVPNVQCWEMFPLSPFIEELKKPEALVPQGLGGTLWSAIGSNAWLIEDSDGLVPSSSATSMGIPAPAKDVLPWYLFVFHTVYYHNKRVIADVAHSLSLSGYETPPLEGQRLALKPAPALDLTGVRLDAVVSRTEFLQEFSKLPANRRPAVAFRQTDIEQEGQGVLLQNVSDVAVFGEMGLQNGDILRGCSDDNVDSPLADLDDLETTEGPILVRFCIVRNGVLLSKQVLVK